MGRSKLLQDLTPSLPRCNPHLEAPRFLTKINYWQLLKSPLDVQFSVLESSFLPQNNAAHILGLTQTPAPVGSNTQTIQAAWPSHPSILLYLESLRDFPGGPGGPGSIPGLETRSHMPQIKILHAAMKMEDPSCRN